MTIILNLIGASASGKTSISKELQKYGYNAIQSYTTRPPRYEGEWGHTFIGEYELLSNGMLIASVIYDDMFLKRGILITVEDMIAYFNSYRTGHHYFATDGQVLRGKVNTYTVDPKGANQVKEFYKDNESVEVINIYIDVDEEIRAKRLIERIPDKTVIEYHDKYKEIPEVWERLTSDRKIFKDVDYDIRVDGNGSIEETVNNILKEVGSKDE